LQVEDGEKVKTEFMKKLKTSNAENIKLQIKELSSALDRWNKLDNVEESQESLRKKEMKKLFSKLRSQLDSLSK
jgi:hypothetical protein